MRKIFCYSDSLLELYKKDYERDTHKFIRASKLEMEHLGVPFEFKGSTYELVGKVDDREVCCKKDDGTMWAMDRIQVQRAIMGDTNKLFPGGRKLKPLNTESHE